MSRDDGGAARVWLLFWSAVLATVVFVWEAREVIADAMLKVRENGDE